MANDLIDFRPLIVKETSTTLYIIYSTKHKIRICIRFWICILIYIWIHIQTRIQIQIWIWMLNPDPDADLDPDPDADLKDPDIKGGRIFLNGGLKSTGTNVGGRFK